MIKGHDNLLVYAKNINEFKGIFKPKDIRGEKVTKDSKEYWIEEDWLRIEFGKYGTLNYEDIEKIKGINKKKEIDQGLKDDIYRLIKKGDKHIVGRLRLIEEDGTKFYSVLKHLNKTGVDTLKQIKMNNYFDYPKPISLIKEIILGGSIFTKNKNDIILDFFSGSGTTAHAVMALNTEDGGNRKCISVQLAEETDEKSEAYKAGYKNIADITKERIKRAAKKIKENNPLFVGDLGMKVFKLQESNFKQWQSNITDVNELEKQIKMFIDPVAENAINENMLYELLLKSGKDLNSAVLFKDQAYYINDNELVILLGNYIL